MATIPAAIAEARNLVQDKGKRKVADRIVGEKGFGLKSDSILMKSYLKMKERKK